MNNISSTRMNMRSMVPESPGIVKRSVIKDYLNSPSKSFSWMCDAPMSRASVILTQLIVIMMVIVLLSAEQDPMLAVAAAMAVAYLVMLLNRKEACNE